MGAVARLEDPAAAAGSGRAGGYLSTSGWCRAGPWRGVATGRAKALDKMTERGAPVGAYRSAARSMLVWFSALPFLAGWKGKGRAKPGGGQGIWRRAVV